jgi:DNA-binding response OmpR family regulator
MPDISSTSVLFIDASPTQRALWTDQLTHCFRGYEILQASDAESGLKLCRSRHIDYVVLELDLPDRTGFELLVELVPLSSRPTIAVIILTQIAHPSLWALAKDNGACACLYKPHTTGEALDRAIQRAVARVGGMPKEDRHRPI